MAVTRCDTSTLMGRAIAAVNAAPAATWTLTVSAADDQRRNSIEILRAIIAADARVCTARAATLGDGYRTLFLADTAELSYGDVFPDHIGPIEQVRIKHVSGDSDYKAGKFDSALTLADIERWRANVGSIYGANHASAGSVLSGFYLEPGAHAFFTGYRLIAKIANFARLLRVATDGAMTSASKTLAATAAFSSADIDAVAVVEGAGASGVPLVSPIDAVGGTSSVTLRDAAGTTVSGKRITIAKCQAPEIDENLVLGIALGSLAKEGDSNAMPPIVQDARLELAAIEQRQLLMQPLAVAQAAQG